MSKTITIENENQESEIENLLSDFLEGFEVSEKDDNKIKKFLKE